MVVVKVWWKSFIQILPQLMVTIWGSCGYFCMGSVRGWSSPAIPSLNRTVDFELSPSDLQWISSFPLLGAVLGSLFIIKPMEYYGRKKALIGHYFVFVFGFLITALASFGKHKSMLYAGRFLMGFAAGSTIPVCQIYVSECASPKIRGRLGSTTISAMALGVWTTYIIGIFVDWHLLTWVFCCLPVLFLFGTMVMPESPSWLLSNNREQEARQSLQFLRGKGTNIEAEMKRIKEYQEMININDPASTTSIVKPLGISLGVMLFQQTTGINAIVFYADDIFQAVGSTMDEKYATIIVGAVQLVFTIASGFLVDRCGRRMLFLGSAITSSVPLATMGTFFYFERQWGDKEATRYFGWLPLASLIVFFVTYSGGMSNVPFIIMGEMFPARHRTSLGAISSSFNLFCTFAMVQLFPDMSQAFGKDGTFYFFTGCTLLSAAFVYFLLPETTGKTLEEMEQLFRSDKSPGCRSNNHSNYVDVIMQVESSKNNYITELCNSEIYFII
ncbi:facilitated trehalose transporter Tret1-like isoform X2 [Daphnia pulex]|uniref:facilitated trehalose transporter Tret1-like isoform X2 n=1 Tax=Daphnia pulex TaxID=6669 RepID=UPI001EDDF0E0|nr:facilitated trehalose transporter Tret1-like isoform X2 [Daphnia pulex]